MFAINDRDEDSASAALSDLFVRCPQASKAFCDLVDPGGAWFRSHQALQIENQHRTDRGRKLDILIRNGNRAMIVECKVLDSIKPFQLRTYYDYWFDKTGIEPLLVWLVQRPQKVIGWASDRAKQITWNQLNETLLRLNVPVRDKGIVTKFCEALEGARITVSPDKCKARKKLTKGYDQEHAFRILNQILASLPGVEGSVEEVNELPPALHLGRTKWRNKFRWIHRVFVYFQPCSQERNVICPFTYKVFLRIFRHGERDTYEQEANQFNRRAQICEKYGLRIKRSVPGKWRRGFDLKVPFSLPPKAGLKWISAYDPAEVDPKPFNWRDEKEAIKAGTLYCKRFLAIVDEW